MDAKKKPEPDDAEQSARFVETARQLESDESGQAFDGALGVVVPTKPAATPVRPSGKRSST
jgi:hypothetical protein